MPRDEVLLSSKNIRLSRPSKKLDNRFLGPFRIIEAIGKQAYQLDLPKAYSRIHSVFHVSLLEPYRRHPGEEPSSPPAAELLPDREEYEVEDILDVRQHREETQRSEEHTSELQSQSNLVCRLLLEKKKNG